MRAQVAAAALIAAAALGQPAALAASVQPGGAATGRPAEQLCTYNQVDLRPFPPGALGDTPWAQRRLAYEQAHRYTVGQGVRVAVIDSGVQGDAPQLAGHVATGIDVTSGTPQPGANTDCFAHGTAVAGIIAAHHRDGVGFVGVAPGVQILPIRETWGVGEPRDPPSRVVDSINLAVRNGASVINISITVDADKLSPGTRNAFRAAAGNAAANDVVIVAASGNVSESEPDQVRTSYPAALSLEFDNVIAVGGIGPDGALYKNSVYGADKYITVVAPASGMVSTFIEKGARSSPLHYCEGTSFAAPFVTGTVALLRSRYPGMHAAEIRHRIEQTADHPSTNLPDPQFGWGVVNPLAALTAVVPLPASTTAGPRVSGPLPPPPAPDVHTRAVAVAVGAGATLVAVALGLAAMVLPRGRRRHWRPGRRPELPAA